MPVDIAKDIITSEFDFVAKSSQFKEISIDFIGGEPLLKFDLIKEIAEWIWSAPRPVPYILFSTTNGTLLDGAMKEWFRHHKKRFYLSLSFDGTSEMHRINRGECLDDIDLDFFYENWPDQPLKMTISPETVDSLCQGIIFLQEKGFRVGASLGYGMPWNEKSVAEYGKQLQILGEYYLEHKNIQPVSLLDLPLQYTLEKPSPAQSKFCGAGTHMAAYDVDGTAYPCHMFTPLVLKSDKSDIHVLQFIENEQYSDLRCRGCVLEKICPTCYGMNYKQRGDIALRDEMVCRLFKEQVLANCWFKTQLLKRKKMNENLSVEDIRLAKSCLFLLKEFNFQ